MFPRAAWLNRGAPYPYLYQSWLAALTPRSEKRSSVTIQVLHLTFSSLDITHDSLLHLLHFGQVAELQQEQLKLVAELFLIYAVVTSNFGWRTGTTTRSQDWHLHSMEAHPSTASTDDAHYSSDGRYGVLRWSHPYRMNRGQPGSASSQRGLRLRRIR